MSLITLTPLTHHTDLTSLKLKFHHEDSDSDLNLSREDDATTQHSNDNTTKSTSDPFHDPNFESFPESLYERIDDFLDNQGLVFSKYSPVLRSRLAKALIPLKRSDFLDLKPRHTNSAGLIQTENKDSDCEGECGTPTLSGFAERRKRRILTQIKSHFQAEEIKLIN